MLIVKRQGDEEEEDLDLNHLGAQALKAELMGDMDRYNEIQDRIRRIQSKPKTEVIMLDGLG